MIAKFLLLLVLVPMAAPSWAQPRSAADLLMLAQERYLEGDLEASSALYRAAAAAEVEPSAAAGHLVTAAWLEFQRGESQRAEGLVDEALERDPEYQFAAEQYVQGFVDLFQFRRGQRRAAQLERSRERVRSGIAALAARDFDAAKAALLEALVITPDDPSAMFNLALVEIERGDTAAAIAGFERILSLAATRPGFVSDELRARTHSSLANAYFRTGAYDDCETAARAALALDSQLPTAWELLGLVQRRSGRLGEAAESFRKALALNPNEARIVSNLATVAIAQQQWLEAVALLSEATRQHPADPTLWLNLGLAQRGMSNLDGAAMSLQRALAIGGGDASLQGRAAAGLALVELDRGRPREAEGVAREAVRLDSANVEARLALGTALLRSGRAGDAVASYQQAVALDPARPETHAQLGVALAAAGRRDQAADAFRRVLELRPGDAEARANLDAVLGGRPLSFQVPPRQTTTVATPQRSSGLTFESIDYLKGALVKDVATGSSADRAGVKRGDLIVAADAKPIDQPADLERAIALAIPGLPIVLDLVRDGVRRQTSLVF
jgi:tetratricopeptide (TPR) repeat protein